MNNRASATIYSNKSYVNMVSFRKATTNLVFITVDLSFTLFYLELGMNGTIQLLWVSIMSVILIGTADCSNSLFLLGESESKLYASSPCTVLTLFILVGSSSMGACVPLCKSLPLSVSRTCSKPVEYSSSDRMSLPDDAALCKAPACYQTLWRLLLLLWWSEQPCW